MRIPNIAELKFHRRDEQLFCLFAKETLWGSFVPQTLSKGFFPNRRRGKHLQDRAWKRSLYTGGEQHYVQGPCCPHYLAHKQCLKQLQVRLVSTGRQHLRDWASTWPHAVPWNWQHRSAMAGFTVLLDRPTSLWASIVIVDALGTMIITRDTVVAQAGRRRGA